MKLIALMPAPSASRWLACGTLAVLLACTGTVELPDGASGPGGSGLTPRAPVVCAGEPGPVLAPLTRLTRVEYERTVSELFGAEVLTEVADALRAIPADEPESEEDFTRMDARLSGQHVDSYFRVADEIATAVSATEARRVALAGECARGGPDDACVREFLPSFLRRALRHDPTSEEVDRAADAAAEFSGAEALHAAVFVTLMSPDFVYRFENRGTPSGSGVLELSPFELATRLAYHFWSGPPDDALLDAAAAGDLSTDAGYAVEVDRLYADERTEETILSFFEEWLHVHASPFAGSPRLDLLRDGIDTDGLPAEMQEEVRDLFRYHLNAGDGWDDALTSPFSFALTPRLADIYGAAPWDGTGTPPMLPPGERSGVLTRAALLTTADGSTNPFRRGAFLRRSALCVPIAPPPATLPPDALQPPPTEAGASTREQFAAKVEEQPCAACHAQFSTLGYVLEAYDGLGRYREEERLITVDGEDRGTVPIDSSGVVAIDAPDEAPVSGPVEMSERIAQSPKANECFAERYVRFTYRRVEVGEDQCVIDALTTRLDEGQSMRDALRSVALDDSFRFRQLEN